MALTSDIQQQVFDLLSKASNLSFISADRDPGGSIALSLTPGQKVTAEVLATLPDSRVQVRVGAELLNLNLPMAVRSGQNLEMTFVSAEPRPTFAIARQVAVAPPVSLTDASRLLSLLVNSEQAVEPQLRSSLQSVGDMLRRSSGEAGVLANLLDEALTYGGIGEGATTPRMSSERVDQPRDGQAAALPQQGRGSVTPDQARLALFESNASQMLQQIARSSRSMLVEAVNQPVVPLTLRPGEEVAAVVTGTLPGGRVFVTVAGTALELVVPRTVQEGEILRMTVIASQPKPIFALPRLTPEMPQGIVSDAGRWLSVLEHGEGGATNQQMFVLERLNLVLKSLPADSPAFTAILDEAITYQRVMTAGRPSAEQAAMAGAALPSVGQQATLQQGNGIILSDDMAKLLQALIKGNRLALLEALNQPARQMLLAPGQQLKADVLAAQEGGRFLVQVAGQTLEFSLPKGLQPGDRLTLFFISAEPTPLFLMTRFGQPGDSRVSETGRWLSSFLGSSVERMPAQETLGILRTLLAGPPADAAQVGTLLQQGLRESGLFYESHLARWFGGEYGLDDILREPQGRLSRLKQPVAASIPAEAGAQPDGAVMPGLKNAALEVLEAAFKKAGHEGSQEGIADQRSLPVVRAQLESLQSGQIVYRGELFAGQPLEWAVAEREARRNSSGEQERSWDTALSIDLPRLGAVSARLKLDGSRLSIAFTAASPASAGLLDRGRSRLVEQLQAAGLAPGEIGISYETD